MAHKYLFIDIYFTRYCLEDLAVQFFEVPIVEILINLFIGKTSCIYQLGKVGKGTITSCQ